MLKNLIVALLAGTVSGVTTWIFTRSAADVRMVEVQREWADRTGKAMFKAYQDGFKKGARWQFNDMRRRACMN